MVLKPHRVLQEPGKIRQVQLSVIRPQQVTMFTEQVRHLKQPVLQDTINRIRDKQAVLLHPLVTSSHILHQLPRQRQGQGIMSMEQGRQLRLLVRLGPINHLQLRLLVLRQVQGIMFL